MNRIFIHNTNSFRQAKVFLGGVIISLWLSGFGSAQTEFPTDSQLIADLQSNEIDVCHNASTGLVFSIASMSLDDWFKTPNYVSEFRKIAEPSLDQIVGLLDHSDKEVVYCALEIMARLGPAASDTSDALETMMNDMTLHPMTRQQAFRALCRVTTKNSSVLSESIDIGLLFDLYNYAALIRLGPDDPLGTATKYSSLEMTTDYLFESCLLGSANLKSEINVLGRHADSTHPKIVRIFSMLLLSAMRTSSKAAIPDLSEQINDTDSEIRFIACLSLIKIGLPYAGESLLIEKSNLSPRDTKVLKKLVDDYKRSEVR